ncbi:hypothetical protein MKW94_024295 [Papaver nudicaule]|uniref:Pentatricopeptide repeat-containing protein n=1 Tax=Papaver nudicaule TaxID=74823 RepID=A0AA41S175_PAPNU|nr:hypothetical protein [Papaver nudicaule]
MAGKLLLQIKSPTNRISRNTAFSQALVKFQSFYSVPESYSLISCNSKTTSYVKDERLDFEFSINVYELRNPYFVNRVVSSCAKLGSLYLARQVHSTIIKLGFSSNVFIGSALVDMYCKCGTIIDARRLFDEIPEKNVVTWNSLFSGYCHLRFCDSAVELFTKMRKVGLYLTPSTISTILGLCSQSDLGELGVQVHGLGIKTGNCSNVVTGTTLIDMYAKCFSVEESRKVFDQMPEKNMITWSSMVSVYAQSHQPDEAIILVKEMRSLGVTINQVTYNSLLSSFSSVKYLDCGKQVHGRVIREGLESNKYLVATLLTMYSECESSEDFYKMCPTISIDDQISWNSVIAGFSHLGNGKEVLGWFIRMRQACIHIDLFTLSNVLRATGILSAVNEGKQIHALINKTGYASDVYVQNALVSMYSRCGAIVDSKQVFSLIKEPDVVSWNSLISGYAHNGYGEEAVELFEKMRAIGIKPDHTTFLSVLSACSHVGNLEKGVQYFDLMRRGNSSEHPSLEHYACMVDLFSRAGHLEEAESFIKSMPIVPGPSVYKALLSACRFHGNVDIAIRSAKSLLELCPNDPATYVMLSSILAQGGHWVDAADVRSLMRERAVENNPGCSWIEVSKE